MLTSERRRPDARLPTAPAGDKHRRQPQAVFVTQKGAWERARPSWRWQARVGFPSRLPGRLRSGAVLPSSHGHRYNEAGRRGKGGLRALPGPECLPGLCAGDTPGVRRMGRGHGKGTAGDDPGQDPAVITACPPGPASCRLLTCRPAACHPVPARRSPGTGPGAASLTSRCLPISKRESARFRQPRLIASSNDDSAERTLINWRRRLFRQHDPNAPAVHAKDVGFTRRAGEAAIDDQYRLKDIRAAATARQRRGYHEIGDPAVLEDRHSARLQGVTARPAWRRQAGPAGRRPAPGAPRAPGVPESRKDLGIFSLHGKKSRYTSEKAP
jgi:hypothetical protein